jgi:hypothetical protein
MAHSLSGIITSFKYTGEMPHVILVGNYYFIPLQKRRQLHYSEEAITPYSELTPEIKKLLKDWSFEGKCCYIETNYFGGSGYQIAETWQDGNRVLGPFISTDGTTEKPPEKGAEFTEDAINTNLQEIGIYRHENKDEFDSVRLGEYRSNQDAIEEYLHSQR